MTITIHEVARRFGISLREVPKIPKHASNIGTGAALSIKNRVVYYTPGDSIYPEHILHEIVHLVVAAPKRITGQPMQVSIDCIPEDLFMLQYERCVARAMGRRMHQGICGLQQDAPTYFLDAPGVPLFEIYGFERFVQWHAGYAMAMRIGLIDRNKRPTWRRPRWNRADGLLVTEAIAFYQASHNLKAAEALA